MAKAKVSMRPKGSANKELDQLLKLAIGSDVWPAERDILYRPDRLKYIRKLIKTEGCVFCKCRKSAIGFDSLVLYKSKWSMIVLNKFPYNPGHLLVMPQRHCGDLLLLADKEYIDLQETFRIAFRAITRAFSPSGINAGLNHGAVAGAGIPEHLHYHLVPRWLGDLNFFPLLAETKAIPTDLESSFNEIARALRKGKK